MGGEDMYHWFEEELKRQFPDAAKWLSFNYEATVTPGVFIATIATIKNPRKPLIKTDVRPEGVRLHFPLSWQQELSAWLGAPPPDEYRLKSNWVNQPSIGVAALYHEPYFMRLASKTIELLKKEIETIS